MAKVGDGLREGTLLVEECKLKNLPVRVARALVNPVATTVPDRLLNLSSDTATVFKGTKLATVEECNRTPIIRAMSVNATVEKVPRISESKQQMLEKMVDRWARSNSFSSCLNLPTYLQKMANWAKQEKSSTPSTLGTHSQFDNLSEEFNSARDRKCRICSLKCKTRM